MEETHIQHLFDVLCRNKDERGFNEIEMTNLDYDVAYVVSSTMGSVTTCDNDYSVNNDIDNNMNSYDTPTGVT